MVWGKCQSLCLLISIYTQLSLASAKDTICDTKHWLLEQKCQKSPIQPQLLVRCLPLLQSQNFFVDFRSPLSPKLKLKESFVGLRFIPECLSKTYKINKKNHQISQGIRIAKNQWFENIFSRNEHYSTNNRRLSTQLSEQQHQLHTLHEPRSR